ncbi:eukaryotic aspartyl protease family protein [Wolffia australiana]
MASRSSFLALLLLVSTLRLCSPATLPLRGIRLPMNHIDATHNFTWVETLHCALRRSKRRINSLVSAQMPVTAGSGEYIVNLAVGTPPVPFSAIIDTGSDLTWMQCQPCTNCYSQSTPIYDPSSSSTYSELSCSSSLCNDLPFSYCRSSCEYVYTYGDLSSTEGVLATETFSLARVRVSGVGFGCGISNQGEGFHQAGGLVGLGRGPLSLISQLRIGRFSYCLTRLGERRTSPLFLGSLATMDSGSDVRSTPFLRNPGQPSFYYLSLRDISVGSVALKIPGSTFAINRDGTGGMIIDSGTSVTFLEMQAYTMLKQEIQSQVNLPLGDSSQVGLDLCFEAPASATALPSMVFHFEGADLELPPHNYMVVDASSGLLCLAIMGSSGLSILGNFQQQDVHMLYDLERGTLSFQPAQCDQM